MFTNSIPRSVVAVMLAFLLAGGAALAQRGEGRGRGGDRGGGDRGGGSARSASGGSERASRSFSGGERASRSRSFSGGPSRSFSEGRGGESIRRSGRPSGGEIRTSRGDDGGRSFQSRRSDDGMQFRSYRGGERQSFGRDSSRTTQFGERSIDSARRLDSDQARRLDSDQARRLDSDQGRGGFQSRRPSEDQVRDFLQMRGDRGDRTARRTGDDFRDFRRDGDRDRDRDELRRRLGDRDRDFGDRDRDFGDRDRDFDDDRDRFVRDRDRDDFRDRDGRGDRDYDRWRRGVWLGERGEGRDHRDWSGRWRDGDRFRTSHYIRDRWFRDRWDDDDHFPFYGNWWSRHHGGWDFWHHYAYRHNRPYYWWTWIAAPRLASWVTYGWPSYYYWDYGPGEYIYYDDGAIYVNGRWYQPAQVFYNRTVNLVEQAPDLSAEEAAEKEWLPLGVFAVTREGSSEPNVLVQLAVTQDGIIGGTAFSTETEEAYAIEGIVEKETQRAVWSYTNNRNQRVLMETSIFNLSQPEATGLVQHGPDQMQVIQLVRLEQPGDSSVASAQDGELPQPRNR